MAAAKAPDEGWVAQLSKLIMSDLTASDRVDAELQARSRRRHGPPAATLSANAVPHGGARQAWPDRGIGIAHF